MISSLATSDSGGIENTDSLTGVWPLLAEAAINLSILIIALFNEF
jgi:hypothetical protein